MKRFLLLGIIAIILGGQTNLLSAQQRPNRLILPPEKQTALCDSIQVLLRDGVQPKALLKIQSIRMNHSRKSANVIFNTSLAEFPIREQVCPKLEAAVRHFFPKKYQHYNITISSDGLSLREMIPQAYSSSPKGVDEQIKRIQKKIAENPPLIKRIDRLYKPSKGLEDRHIALWQSHGWYYEQKLLRWEWQRARIFETVEDLYTQSYVLPFLVPMLENAGATVLMPRERDTQLSEIIADFDSSDQSYSEENGFQIWYSPADSGFAHNKAYYLNGENPFHRGTYRAIKTYNAENRRQAKRGPSTATWKPEFPQDGEYAVYVSYKSLPQSADDAVYTVCHRGGESHFRVNQQMGGGTWIYLGTFPFEKGANDNGCVILSNQSANNKAIITADAVKFGGGMGNIARVPQDSTVLALYGSEGWEPLTSGYPRFTEGARYWLQWAGFNDTVYNKYEGKNDYTDDYSSRPRWVNALCGGSPFMPEEDGLNIPVDLSFAFHTDAGTYLNDSIVGTLAIYTRNCDGELKLPTGESRDISREYTDMVQSQIVNDIRTLFTPDWKRRQIWNRSYAESRIPQVPAMLLELLSHQNFADMRYGLDPTFRFYVSRAIYKGMLRFLSQRYGTPYVVQPLPVENFRIQFASSDKSLDLQWDAVNDPLEASALPTSYILYTRVDNGVFDAGRIVDQAFANVSIEPGHHYSFKVTAINQGGESFPSEILSAYKAPQEKNRALIINSFTRISAPDSYSTPDTTRAGFTDDTDFGVPYLKDISYIGKQYEFRRNIPWMDDDSPGFGSSYADYETQVIAGNTFDYPIIHGRGFAENGISYCSVSLGAVTSGKTELRGWPIVDVILGKQKAILRGGLPVKEPEYFCFPQSLRDALSNCASDGSKLILSGSYIASDLWDGIVNDSTARAFGRDVLKILWRSGLASHTGEVGACVSPYLGSFRHNKAYSFTTKPNQNIYSVESPDAIEPSTPGAFSIFRYLDNNLSAGVAYKGEDYSSVALGFPIESLQTQEQVNTIMTSILKFFEQ